ncbi:MAG: hypothetical protein WD894_13175 [Pirellulales bacterium]
MLVKWAKTIKLKLSWDDFLRLPQNPAYKYEYLDGEAWLAPHAKLYHAVLELADFRSPEPDLLNDQVQIRRLEDHDWENLPGVFVSAFARVSPFAYLDDEEQLAAARDCLGFTRSGGNGQIIPDATVVALDPKDGSVVGGFLVTLVPDIPLSDADFGHVPKKNVSRRQKLVPHLTWVFVKFWSARHGIATAMLAEAAESLRGLGHTRMTTTFLLGNESSTLWHWRVGFRLAAYSMSQRQFERRTAKVSSEPDVASEPTPQRKYAKK